MSDPTNRSDRKHLPTLARSPAATTVDVASTHRALDRRAFIKLLGVATTALGAACTGRTIVVSPDASEAGIPDAPASDAAVDAPPRDANNTGLPTLGGAPDTAQGRTIAAFCDTVLPGMYRDPLGKPGAIDANTPALFFDPSLPAAPLVPVLVVLLDGASRRANGGRLFAALTPDEREQTLVAAVADVPELEFGIQLVKLGFYSSDLVRDYLGYPGANAGYRNDPDFTFGVAVATERTTDGNLP